MEKYSRSCRTSSGCPETEIVEEELSGDDSGVVTASSSFLGAFVDEEEVEGFGVVVFWVLELVVRGGVFNSLAIVEAKIVCTLLSPFLFM